MKFSLKTVLPALFFFIFLTDQTPYSISVAAQQTLDQPIRNISFRLLAIEANFNNTPVESAQHLIENLKLFTNWQNGTSANFQYSAYIHLLSNINYEEIDPECQQHYRGNATRDNIINEITSFLNETLENEYSTSILVFYYVGHSGKWVNQGKTSFYMELDEPLFDWEINEVLPSNQPQKSTLMILDTSYSGGYITTLQKLGRIILAGCNPTEEAVAGWFTGYENAFYPDGTVFGPMGIVGAFHAAEDINKDGWLSADEIFRFSWGTLVNFASNQTTPRHLHPMACYGVAGGALPLVQLDQTKPYPGNAKDCTPKMFLPNSSRYNWSQLECHTYRYSVRRTGFAEVDGTRTPDLLWVLNMNASIKSSQVVADGIVYVTTMNGKIYALDLKTGNEIWMFNTNSSISSTPSVDKGLVIFGTEGPGKIYAFDAYTGLVRWLYEIPETGVCSSQAILEERVIIGSSEGRLYCLSQFEGELLWVSYIGGGKLSSPAIADNTIFITSPHIYAVNLSTGSPIWRYTTSWPVFSSPAVADGLVFVGAENDDKVFAFEQKTGRLVWSFQTGGWLTSPAVDSYKKLVVVGCRDARVYCLSELTGFLKWQFVNAPNHLSAPTISKDGLIYVGSTDGNLYCLDEETGIEIWKYNVGSPIVSSPTVIHQHVIVASEDGKLFCFGPPFPTHNIAVSNVSASPSKIREGEQLEVNFTVKNHGESEEKSAVTVSLNCSNKIIKQFADLNGNITVLPGEDLNYTLYLNSTDIPLGYCNIIIEAQIVLDETDASDNADATDTITIIAPIDIDGNGEINIMDIYKVAAAYNTEPGHPKWSPDADVNKDNVINIVDVFLVGKKFGEKYL